LSPGTTDQQLRVLLDRVQELEAEMKRKDEEIAMLQREVEGQKQAAVTQNDTYKKRSEAMKLQYDQLKEALASEGKCGACERSRYM
jgi:predicted RNase H-like nuclease (RuvC/YqgF family)